MIRAKQLRSLRKRLQYTWRKGMETPLSKEVSYYASCCRHLKVKPRVVLYEAHFGAGMTGSPYALFTALRADPRHAGLTHVWAVASVDELRRLSEEYRGHRDVRFVRRNGREHLRQLATAGYLVHDTVLPAYFAKRTGQLLLHTWHTSAVRPVGYDAPAGNTAAGEVVRNLLMADYLLSPNPAMTDVFRDSFRLQGLFPGKVLEFGHPDDDQRIAQRVVDAVFGGELDQDGVVADFIDPGRKRVLFYGAGFGNNGVTAALLALLSQLDRSRYDLTVAGIVSPGASAANFGKLTDARAIARPGPFTLSRWEAFGIQYVRRYGLSGPLARVLRPEVALKRDFERWFGAADFDYIIDYSGYGSLFPCVARQHEGSTKLIWQHADLEAEFANKAKRDLPQYRRNPVTRTALKNAYVAFDKVVACGEAVLEVNLRKLGTPQTRHKFTFASNVVDAERVRRLCALDGPTGSDSYQPIDPPDPGSAEPFLAFVTMGRLSPEKNHENLIRGFAQFVAEHPNSRLYILGGGPLEDSLHALVRQLNLSSVVTLTGALENPFPIVKRCDCFILPSLHEGNALVVPEVRMLGLPIILSRFASVGSSCLPNGQLVVGFSPEEIRDGLEAFRQGRVPADYRFDVDAYNAEAVAQFERLLS